MPGHTFITLKRKCAAARGGKTVWNFGGRPKVRKTALRPHEALLHEVIAIEPTPTVGG
jgi:hypothetical protein